MKIILATNNKHKVEEIKNILDSQSIKLLTLNDLNIKIEIVEDKKTLEGNSRKKAEEVHKISKLPTLADDTGLFVEALNREPGVYSSRYSGENATYESNCRKLLKNLEGIPDTNRNAYFKTVVCYYVSENNYYFFEGIMNGKIISEHRGKNGFGYDPIFVPDGFDKTYAEMTDKEKNSVSHRAKAFQKVNEYLINNIIRNQSSLFPNP
jgi:XTP/dITP diphosphohydrolase